VRDAAPPRLKRDPNVPLYDYDCAACGRRFEVIHGIHDGPPTECPLCGSGPVRKAFAAPAVHFKGSGWAKKERRAAVKTSSASKGEGSDGDAGGSDAAGGEAAGGDAAGGGGKSTSSEGSAPAKDPGTDKTPTSSTSTSE
jgi:putative FmdB family regulatory protein